MRGHRTGVIARCGVLVALVCSSSGAWAQTAPGGPTTGWRLRAASLSYFRLNPIGLETQARIGPHRVLYLHDSPVLADNYVHPTVQVMLNPALARAGLSLETQPASVVRLRAHGNVVRFFGILGHVQSFETPLADYSPDALEEGRDAERASSSSGAFAGLDVTLQARVGRFVVRDKTTAETWSLSLPESGTVFYDPIYDTLIEDGGLILSNDADLAFQVDDKLLIGARYTGIWPLYSDSLPSASDNQHHRVGPLAVYTLSPATSGRFVKPSLVGIAAWYLDHRYRAGQEVSRAVPYVVIAFAFQSDLID